MTLCRRCSVNGHPFQRAATIGLLLWQHPQGDKRGEERVRIVGWLDKNEGDHNSTTKYKMQPNDWRRRRDILVQPCLLLFLYDVPGVL